MQGLTIKLPSAVTDPTLPKLGEYRIGLMPQGTGLTVCQLSLGMTAASEITIYGGDFYSSSVGTTKLASTIALASGANTIYLRATSAEGFVSIKESAKINAVGLSASALLIGVGLAPEDSNPNGTAAVVNLDKTPVNVRTFNLSASTIIHGSINSLLRATDLNITYLRQTNAILSKSTFGGTLVGVLGKAGRDGLFYITNNKATSIPLSAFSMGASAITINGDNSANGTVVITGQLSDLPANTYSFETTSNVSMATVTGSLSDLKSLLTSVMIYQNNLITGSLSSLPALVTKIVLGSNTGITYAASKVWPANMKEVYIPLSVFVTAQLDQLLIDLAAATWLSSYTTKRIVVKGVRSSASDAALATLITKGVTVTITAP